ncbi:hypothetical protein MYX04_06435 [Nitrospiraceae bacterium AH_259_D15_M11_P09]|nr:hypothetical protein [Nitrospiraceae bacterium AH_259_D15_M11_P09]
MSRQRASQVSDPVVQELSCIKRLLGLLLMKAGTDQKELAIALQMDQGDVSRMLPTRKIKKWEKKR